MFTKYLEKKRMPCIAHTFEFKQDKVIIRLMNLVFLPSSSANTRRSVSHHCLRRVSCSVPFSNLISSLSNQKQILQIIETLSSSTKTKEKRTHTHTKPFSSNRCRYYRSNSSTRRRRNGQTIETKRKYAAASSSSSSSDMSTFCLCTVVYHCLSDRTPRRFKYTNLSRWVFRRRRKNNHRFSSVSCALTRKNEVQVVALSLSLCIRRKSKREHVYPVLH